MLAAVSSWEPDGPAGKPRGSAVPAGEVAYLPPLPPNPVSEVLHQRAMQDELLVMKPILPQQQRFLDQAAIDVSVCHAASSCRQYVDEW